MNPKVTVMGFARLDCELMDGGIGIVGNSIPIWMAEMRRKPFGFTKELTIRILGKPDIRHLCHHLNGPIAKKRLLLGPNRKMPNQAVQLLRLTGKWQLYLRPPLIQRFSAE